MATISQRIQEALEIRGMKQSELSQKTKIGKSSISTYISGSYEPKQKNLYKIAQALDVNESWLMGFDVPMERSQSQALIKQENDASISEQLQVLLDNSPSKTLIYLSRLCRNKRIQSNKTEKFIAECSKIPLGTYLDFEVEHKNIGVKNIENILNSLDIESNFAIGFLTGCLLNDSEDVDTPIDKLYPKESDNLKTVLKLFAKLPLEAQKDLIEQLKK